METRSYNLLNKDFKTILTIQTNPVIMLQCKIINFRGSYMFVDFINKLIHKYKS